MARAMNMAGALAARFGSTWALPVVGVAVGGPLLAIVLALSGYPRIAAGAVVVSVLGDLLLTRKAPTAATILTQANAGLPLRWAIRVGAVFLVAGLFDSRAALVLFCLFSGAFIVVACSRALHETYRHVGPIRPLRTRGVTGNPHIDELPPPRVELIVLAQLLILVPGPAGAPWWAVLIASLAGISALSVPTVADLRATWALRVAKRATGLTKPLHQVQAFIDEYQPEVLVHLSGPDSAAYQINSWLETLEALDQRVLIIIRDHPLFEKMSKTTIPAISIPNAGDFLMLKFSAARVALYPSNTGNNIHLLRTPHIMSAFIGHGDSDKSASANPFSRVYDELWVAGQAGADRYRRSGLGIAESQFRFVGRPQVHRIEHISASELDPMRTRTVLYAPTWEGVNFEQEYSSVRAAGIGIVKALLAADPAIRIVYKPHPFTGLRDAKYRGSDAAIARLLDEAAASTGIDHRVVRSGSIVKWFNASDALITDISSVVSDYLASEKPYAVFNHTPLSVKDFRETFPSSAAATIIGSGGEGVSEFVDVINGHAPDRLAEYRGKLARHLLGDLEQRTLEAFAAHVTAFVARSSTERAMWRDGANGSIDSGSLGE